MLITNGDRLKHHFETTIAVKTFTVPEILTIIDTFSVDIPKETEMVIPVNDNDIVHMTLESFMDFKTSKISEAADDFITMPRHIGMKEAYKLQSELKNIIGSEAESEEQSNEY